MSTKAPKFSPDSPSRCEHCKKRPFHTKNPSVLRLFTYSSGHTLWLCGPCYKALAFILKDRPNLRKPRTKK